VALGFLESANAIAFLIEDCKSSISRRLVQAISRLGTRGGVQEMRLRVLLIVAGILVVCIAGAFMISRTLGVAAIIGSVFFLIVFGLAFIRPPLRTEDELYDEDGRSDD
jgi:hypothetical protein